MRSATGIILMTLAMLVASVSEAKFSDKVIATGPKALAMWNSLPGSARTLMPTGGFHTKFKMYNLTQRDSSQIREGEKGILCDHYVDAALITEAGTDYLCHLVDLTK